MPVEVQELHGLKITMPDGSTLGRVDAVYLDDRTGAPNWASVKVGALRRHRALVPLATATIGDGKLQVPYGKARVKDSPAIDPGVHIARDLEARLREHYGLAAGTGVERDMGVSGESPGDDPSQGDGAIDAVSGVPPRPSPVPLPRFEGLRATQMGRVLTVTLDRPPANTLDRGTYEELNRLFSDIDAFARDVRAVVLTGTGRYFSAGDDRGDLAATATAMEERERGFHVREALWAVRECPLPVIGAVNGSAVDTGVALAASCDFLIAGADATFQFSEPGVARSGGARHLTRILPEPIVRWMYLTGEAMPAARMATLGAVVRVATRSALDEATEEARRLASLDRATTRAAKRALNDSEALGVRRGFEVEQAEAAKPTARARLQAA